MARFARPLRFRRTAEGIYANLDAPTRVLLQRYSDGINASLELPSAVRRKPRVRANLSIGRVLAPNTSESVPPA
ncbi:penicillin acylase family protein [Pseudomonas aeruginosa]